MVKKSKIAIIAMAMTALVSAAAAQQGQPATIDLQKTCRVTEKAVSAVFGDAIQNVFERCLENEKAARQQLIKEWSTYSVADRSLCIQPRAYQPSYAEWLTCTEMQRDVRRLRQNPPAEVFPTAPGAAPLVRTGAAAKRCPIVKYGPDGGMVSAIACSLH